MPILSFRHKGLKQLFEDDDHGMGSACVGAQDPRHEECLACSSTPPQLGDFIWREIIEPDDLSVTDAAAALGVTRQALSNLLNEHTALTAEMAMRIEKAFGSSMELLMRMQLAYDLAQVRLREREIRVKRYGRASRK